MPARRVSRRRRRHVRRDTSWPRPSRRRQRRSRRDRRSFTAPPQALARDEAGYAKEVAQLNRQNDPHSIPTIDPSARESSSKSYQFAIPSSARGDEHGNGIITPTRSWRDGNLDCYYGRYEYTYGDGAMEEGNIAWPFCYDPDDDPFKLPPHPIPFPLPLPGFRLPADADLPPLEKTEYQRWAAANKISPP